MAEAGAWKYAFIYQVTARHYPEIPEKARKISESQARSKLLECYFDSVGASQTRDVNKLFGWSHELSQRALGRLVEAGTLRAAGHPELPGEWLALPGVCK